MPKEKFETILKEIHLAEAEFEINKKNSTEENAENELRIKYVEIYKEYEVSADVFRKSLEYYAGNPEKLEKIYVNLLGKLKQEKIMLDQ